MLLRSSQATCLDVKQGSAVFIPGFCRWAMNCVDHKLVSCFPPDHLPAQHHRNISYIFTITRAHCLKMFSDKDLLSYENKSINKQAIPGPITTDIFDDLF